MVLRGLVLNGGVGKGIIANTVGTLHVENCVISGFSSHGIIVIAAGSSTFIKDTISRQNLMWVFLFNGRASIDHCRFEKNSSDGVFAENAGVTVRDSVSAGNGGRGFDAFGEISENTVLNVYQCMATNNAAAGLYAENTGTGLVIARVANSAVSENNNGLFNGGGTVTFESLGNNLVRGNSAGDIIGPITTIMPL